MPDKILKVLCVHGLGDHRTSDWQTRWPEAIRRAFPRLEGLDLSFEFVTYDDVYDASRITLADTARAIWKLASSGVTSPFRRERGVLSSISEKVKWTAGYVVAWVEDEPFKTASRARVLAAVRQSRPDVILAHSLGSLVTYNAFSHADAQEPELKAILRDAHYVTLGSQIANPFVVRNLTNGRVQPLPVRHWHHLYNKHDDVFTAEIRLPGSPTFTQVDTPFDDEGTGDHAAPGYFQHAATVDNVWRAIGKSALSPAEGPRPRTGRGTGAKGAKAAPANAALTPEKTRKALLVGINDYPDPAQRLEGCVNDVFTMSALLQDCGFPPESIRICLDDRATAAGILERLKWLLDDPKPGDELVFYYSGHGAQVPEYGEDFEPDHHVETLVPWDFDWTRETYLSDDQIYGLYSQLPYDTRLALIFDCCHSGSMHRDGSRKPRGLTPPDDIRHRELKWDRKAQMWVARDFVRINPTFSKQKAVVADFFGRDGATERIGRASMLRGLSASQYDGLKKKDSATARGPYLPLIIEACGEAQSSFEYRHGAVSHGAFTFSLDSILRREKNLTFARLIELTTAQLAELQYDQKPQILGPAIVVDGKVPWAV